MPGTIPAFRMDRAPPVPDKDLGEALSVVAVLIIKNSQNFID
jgi:hypothetical protein